MWVVVWISMSGVCVCDGLWHYWYSRWTGNVINELIIYLISHQSVHCVCG